MWCISVDYSSIEEKKSKKIYINTQHMLFTSSFDFILINYPFFIVYCFFFYLWKSQKFLSRPLVVLNKGSLQACHYGYNTWTCLYLWQKNQLVCLSRNGDIQFSFCIVTFEPPCRRRNLKYFIDTFSNFCTLMYFSMSSSPFPPWKNHVSRTIFMQFLLIGHYFLEMFLCFSITLQTRYWIMWKTYWLLVTLLDREFDCHYQLDFIYKYDHYLIDRFS